jgi:hypothetical protein
MVGLMAVPYLQRPPKEKSCALYQNVGESAK